MARPHLLAVFILATCCLAAQGGHAQGSPGGDAEPRAERDRAVQAELMWVRYEGELLDQASAPISGIFPMVFSFYPTADGDSPSWVELQSVAVIEGRYEVFLGRTRGVPRAWDGQTVHLGVALGDAGEVTRHAVALESYVGDDEGDLPSVIPAGNVELAGYALSADSAVFAHECRALDGRTARELDRFEQLMTRVNAIRETLDRARDQRVARESQPAQRIGGAGGVRYQRTCPPGFVMTGARGGMGNLVDGFRIICTELL